MHIDCEYGMQIISDNLLESPSAEGFLDSREHFQNKSKRMLYVYDNEGPIPHCHILGLGKDGKKEVCVKLDEAEYFCHGYKTNKFTKDEKDMFIKFINSEDSFGVLRWKWAASTWNGFAQRDSSNMRKITNKVVPNYKDLITEKN